MKVVLFSRVPLWYSFKNERLARRLAADGHEVAGVKLLGRKSESASIGAAKLPEFSPAVHFVKSHNSPECVAIRNKIAPDLIVLRGCGTIKKQVLDVPKIGVINPHYAKLPDFRGMDVTEWSVLCGADVAVSVHTVNEGVDTGVVLRSEMIKPSTIDTVGSLRDKSAALVVELRASAVSDFANGKKFPFVESTEPRRQPVFPDARPFKTPCQPKAE